MDRADQPPKTVTFNNVGFEYGNTTSSSPGKISVSYADINGGRFLAPGWDAGYGSFSLTDSMIQDLGSYIDASSPTADSFIERNVFVRSGGISSGTLLPWTGDLFIRNNVFAEQTTPYAVENWAASGPVPVVEFNSFLARIGSRWS